jgi:hypothetical protein
MAGREAEHLDRAAGDALHADDRAHQGGLAAAAGTHEARHGSARDLEPRDADRVAPAAPDEQIADPDGHGRHEVIIQ